MMVVLPMDQVFEEHCDAAAAALDQGHLAADGMVGVLIDLALAFEVHSMDDVVDNLDPCKMW